MLSSFIRNVAAFGSRATVIGRRQMSSQVDKLIILGAAGRDFHDFITYWSKQNGTKVVAFSATQIPGIDGRRFPKELCNNDMNGNLYPDGIPIFSEDSLETVIKDTGATTCALAYSDLSYDTVQSLASRVNAAGCKFVQLPPKLTMVESHKPVVAICASRTGVGKSQTTRYVANYYKNKGLKVAVCRHPMPYDKDLLRQACQRYEKLEDMDKYHCTVEEREEYCGHIEEGNLLFAGVDYPTILREAEKEADIIIWDGGNNDLPFFQADLHLTLVDSLRPTDQECFYPGETNVRLADAILITKVNDVMQAGEQAARLEKLTKAPILYGTSVIFPEATDPVTGKVLSETEAGKLIDGKRVLVIDDGPTLTHGGMPFGAGYVLANQLGAAEIIDPRPYAYGSLQDTFRKFPHLKKGVLPAMGYGEEQIRDLSKTIEAIPCDAVVIGTPSDLTHLIDIQVPTVRARYDLCVLPEHIDDFSLLLDSLLARYGLHHLADDDDAA